MGLFSKTQIDSINKIAKQSKQIQPAQNNKKVSSMLDELAKSSEAVLEYFKDSPAILITSKEQLHEYVSKAIESKFISIDTETTGLDRATDYIVGASLYYPGGVECYIPFKHRVPIFEDLYKGQLEYQDFECELKRLVESQTKAIFANANFDLYMIWKDIKVDLCPIFYYDTILAWRCIKEDERFNDLKSLYNKYVLGGKGDPKKFSDFFSPALFPYSKPQIAKLYAANDAKITYDLFKWQVPKLIPSHERCKADNLQYIANLVWNVEFPIVSICQEIERTGMYLDQNLATMLKDKYHNLHEKKMSELKSLVQEALETYPIPANKPQPFRSGSEFNPRSTLHVKYLVYDLLQLPKTDGGEGTGVGVLSEFNNPITNKIVEVRSLATNISTFVDKLPNAVDADERIHADFKQIGAATGRMSSANPNLMNIPSKLDDIRHMFRANPSQIINKVCKKVDSTLTLSLNKFDSIKDSLGNYTKVYNLKQGDEIQLYSGKTLNIAKIQSITHINNEYEISLVLD